mmetsp:Transcript_16645/g.22913  ORF Transcript_16645/g.22913 Transcript_16645/m.22913 type:complete len:115 (+) Transcript_16645:142-486(+)
MLHVILQLVRLRLRPPRRTMAVKPRGERQRTLASPPTRSAFSPQGLPQLVHAVCGWLGAVTTELRNPPRPGSFCAAKAARSRSSESSVMYSLLPLVMLPCSLMAALLTAHRSGD